MNYVIFDENALYDFKNVIIPDTYNELFVTSSFERAGIVCIGAVEKGRALGAIIIGFHEEPVVSVLSLYVSPEFRNQGIGSALISYATVHALSIYPFEVSFPQITLCLEYALPGNNAEQFQKFLKKNQFALQQNLGRITIVNADACRKHLNVSKTSVKHEIHSADTLSDTDAAEFTAFLEDCGFRADAEFCFILGEPADPACVLIAEYGEGQDFYISSAAPGDEVSPTDYRALLAFAVRTISAKYPQFILIAEDVRNVCPEVWDELSADGECAVRGAAVLIADLKEGE